MFDWRAYLELAESLAQDADEASYRSAISRAYYAAYHIARERVSRTRLQVLTGHDAHKVLWDSLKRDVTHEWRQAGLEGDRLHRARKRADYEPDFADVAGVVPTALERARTIIGLMET